MKIYKGIHGRNAIKELNLTSLDFDVETKLRFDGPTEYRKGSDYVLTVTATLKPELKEKLGQEFQHINTHLDKYWYTESNYRSYKVDLKGCRKKETIEAKKAERKAQIEDRLIDRVEYKTIIDLLYRIQRKIDRINDEYQEHMTSAVATVDVSDEVIEAKKEMIETLKAQIEKLRNEVQERKLSNLSKKLPEIYGAYEFTQQAKDEIARRIEAKEYYTTRRRFL